MTFSYTTEVGLMVVDNTIFLRNEQMANAIKQTQHIHLPYILLNMDSQSIIVILAGSYSHQWASHICSLSPSPPCQWCDGLVVAALWPPHSAHDINHCMMSDGWLCVFSTLPLP